jgi:dinuclear metal center YbgI/SA1388 family protein
MVCVGDIMRVLDRIAPLSLAEEWDNCGLQIGSRHWPVRKILVALDPLPGVMEAAAQHGVDMVITHHPLLFRPLRTIDLDTSTGRVIDRAMASHIALYAAHTCLDSAVSGVNDVLASCIGLTGITPLVPTAGPHPENHSTGMGRVGFLTAPIPLEQLARSVKSALDLDVVKIAGDPSALVHHVALCSGSGASLLDAFFASEAEVYISGDLRYHDARAAEDAGRAVIDVGHFPSEIIVIDALVERLREDLANCEPPVSVNACRLEKDPFIFL